VVTSLQYRRLQLIAIFFHELRFLIVLCIASQEESYLTMRELAHDTVLVAPVVIYVGL